MSLSKSADIQKLAIRYQSLVWKMFRKNFGSEKIFGPQKIWVWKFFGFNKKSLGLEIFLFWQIFCSEEILGLKNILSEKILDPKIIWSEEILGTKNILGSKQFLHQLLALPCTLFYQAELFQPLVTSYLLVLVV